MAKLHKAFTVLLILASLVACTSSPATPTPTPIPTPEPVCEGNVCIRQVFATIKGDMLQIEFDLSDKNGNVEFGNSPKFTGQITVGAYRLEKDGKENYVFGVQIPEGKYVCYSGNDLPWTNGKLGATCGIGLPLNIMQVRLNAGDIIRIEMLEFNFEQTVNVK